jgi:hypothetical protein
MIRDGMRRQEGAKTKKKVKDEKKGIEDKNRNKRTRTSASA